MLRQVYVLKGENVIYSITFGTAFSADGLTQVKERLAEFIKEPVDNTIFNRPLFNFQVVYASIQKLFFLLVTDLTDRPEYVKEELKPLAAKFTSLFPSVPGDLKNQEKLSEFEQFLIGVHKNLHPKIAFAGQLGAGKTTLAQLVRAQGGEGRFIMNFAKMYPVQIGKLTFDLWDWVNPDLFSPLWNNFARGSDVFLIIVESTPESIKGAGQFLTLHQREAKGARIAVICNKQDLPGAIAPDQVKDQLAGVKAYGISATGPNAKVELLAILEDILDLKKPLPPEFKQLVISANEAISKDEHARAIELLTKVADMAKAYNEMSFYQTFQDKITVMQQKLAEKQKRDRAEAAKIKAPETHTFGQKVAVKTLLPKAPVAQKPVPANIPATVPVPQPVVVKPQPPAPASGVPKSASPQIPLIPAKPTIAPPPPVPANPVASEPVLGPVLFANDAAESSEGPDATSPPKQAPDVQGLAVKLRDQIRNLGLAFQLENCKAFVERLLLKFGRAPTDAELEKAAQALVAQARKMKPPA